MEMKNVSIKELELILENHKHWLKKDCDSWENLCADLWYADLHEADLHGANLSRANLSEADLHEADLYRADLSGANLHEADLSGVDLSGADLSEVKHIPYIYMVCPEEGAFIGWKKAEISEKQMIVKLSIPESAKRLSSTSRKCRCNKAKVLEIYNLDGTVAEERECYSSYDKNFIYEVGKTVNVDDFNEDRWKECTQGIHFFMNRQEAINYNYN